MFALSHQPRNYSKALKNLQMCSWTEGLWIDAGCGAGTYSLGLSFLVDQVIAIDTNNSSLKTLGKYIELNNIKNITPLYHDFNDPFGIISEKIQGMLFAFSLHFQRELQKVLTNAYESLHKNNGQVVIIEYERSSPVPWVPWPVPKKNLVYLMKKFGFSKFSLVFQNRRYYIISAETT